MDPEMYFRLLEPNKEKLNQIMKTLKMVLERRRPNENRLAILIIRGPVNSGKTTLINMLCSMRVSQAIRGELVNSIPPCQPTSAWNIDFTKHFIWVRDLYNGRGVNGLGILKDLSTKDSQLVWNKTMKKSNMIQPTFWFLLDDSEANASSISMPVPKNMEQHICYIDLTQQFNHDYIARRAFQDALNAMDMNAFEQYIINYTV